MALHADSVPSVKEETSHIAIFRIPMGKTRITEVRNLNYQQANETLTVNFTNLPNFLDSVQIEAPTEETLQVESLNIVERAENAPKEANYIGILKQNYAKKLTIKTQDKEYEGRLIAVENNVTILRTKEAELIVIQNKEITNYSIHENASHFVENENSASFQNRVLASLSSAAIGKIPLHLTYLSDDFFWCAEYLVIIDEANDQFYFSGKYNIQNNSGKTFENAHVALMMGHDNYHYLQSSSQQYQSNSTKSNIVSKMLSNKQFSYDSDGDDFYNDSNSQQTNKKQSNSSNNSKKNSANKSKYTDKVPTVSRDLIFHLPNPVTLPSSKSVQFNFAHGTIQPINQHYLVSFHPYKHHSKCGLLDRDKDIQSASMATTKILLEFPNNEDNNLGFPLPHGDLVVYYRNQSTNQLIDGENHLQATTIVSRGIVPSADVGELVQIPLNHINAYHIDGNKERVSFQKNDAKKTIVESWKITVHNNTPNTPIIIVEDCLPRWASWNISDSSIDHHFNGSDKVRWAISDLLPGGKYEITYTVQYAW